MKLDKAKPQPKPLMLAMRDAESKLVKTVNEVLHEDNIPCYFLEMLLDKIHRQIKDGAGKELAQANAQYLSEKPEEPKNEPGKSKPGGKDGENGLGT